MTNKSSSKQHGLHMIDARRPKSKQRFRDNKAKSNQRKQERRAITGFKSA